MKSIAKTDTLHLRRADVEFERVVFAEVIVPESPNVYGDYWTFEAVKEAAYEFMRQGYEIDIEHDHEDVSDRVFVCESFIARDGDPDFIPGAWVVGMKINDDQIWQDVLDGKINGYSFEALVNVLAGQFAYTDDGIRKGWTEPDPVDGHTHEFVVIVGEDTRPISGGTTETNGHAHLIKFGTATEKAAGHTHRYNMVTGKDGK